MLITGAMTPPSATAPTMPSKKKPSLTWKKINDWTEIAIYDETTFVLTRNRGAGKKNRFNLTATHGSLEPAILGRELTPSHCRNIANDLYHGLYHCTETPAVVRIEKIRGKRLIAWRAMTRLVKANGGDIRQFDYDLWCDIRDYKYLDTPMDKA